MDVARRAIEAEGTTILAGSGNRKGHPALAMLGTARAQAMALLDRFGLNPVARQRVETVNTFMGGKFAGLIGGADDPAERYFDEPAESLDEYLASNPSRTGSQ